MQINNLLDIAKVQMVASPRQIMIALLVLLQLAAPLVHAHVGSNVAHTGLHLHEFEQIHWQRAAKPPTQVANHRQISAPDAIVELGSTLNQRQISDEPNTHLFFYLCSYLQRLAARPVATTIRFSSSIPVPITEPFLSHNTSRAPPV